MMQTANTLSMNTLRFDENCFIRSLVHNGKSYFSSRDICSTLGYSNVAQALNQNCRQEYIVELKDIASNRGDIEIISPTEVEEETALQHANRMREKWLEEPGVYQLLSRSKKPEAEPFQKCLYEEVLPSLRRNGSYTVAGTRNQQVSLINETDLHHKTVELIRRRYPDALIVAGLGENQTTTETRIESWRKGYTKGQPDITLPVKSGRKTGLAFELKSPGWNGEASEHQKVFLRKLEANGWQVMCSNCYEDLIFAIRDYMEPPRGRKRARS